MTAAPEFASLCLAIVGAGSFITAAEHLARSQTWTTGGPQSWLLGQLRHRYLTRLADSTAGAVLGDAALRVWFVCHALVGALAAACGIGLVFVPELGLALAVTKLPIFLRTRYGHDGADQMMLMVSAALGLGTLDRFGSSPRITELALYFVAGQAVLAYAASGCVKLADASWRRGRVVSGVLGTSIYGTPRLGRFLRERRVLDRGLTWAVVAFEVGFVLVLLGDPLATYTILTIGVLFHTGNAALMGLNTFFWAFVAAYPAVAYLAV